MAKKMRYTRRFKESEQITLSKKQRAALKRGEYVVNERRPSRDLYTESNVKFLASLADKILKE